MEVRAKVCNECLFSKAKIVGADRVQDILDLANDSGRAFECHKSTLAGTRAICRAFFDGNHSLVVRLAKMYGWYEYVEEATT